VRDQVNEYGLTFAEWLGAAGYGERALALLEAWQNGEDPTDHAAELQHARHAEVQP